MENVQYRKAVPDDASAVVALANELEFNKGDDGQSATEHGFLLYAKSEETYKQRFSVSKNSVVAELDGKLIGYLIVHDRDEHKELGDLLRYPITLKNYLLNQIETDYLYIDQIAIYPEYQQHGIGQHLYDFVFADISDRTIIACVAIEPLPNHASEAFFTKNGFAKKQELQEGDWLCGVYMNGE